MRQFTLVLLIVSGFVGVTRERARAQVYGYPAAYRPATAGESYARGMADMTRSRGFANYANSEAAINRTQATSNYLDNRSKATSTYFSMRAENRAARAAERPPIPTSEQLIRYAQAGKPKPLESDQLNPSDGKVYWPRALRADTFESYRDEVQEICTRRAAAGGKISDDDYYKVEKVLKEMTEDLRKNLSDFSSEDYMTAKHFLDSLAYELQS